MMKNFVKKIRSNNGESIAETLVALLIAALGMTMLAMMITSSINLINTSNEKMKEYVEIENKISEFSPTISDTSYQVYLEKSGSPVYFNKDDSIATVEAYYTQDTMGKYSIISFKKKAE